MLYNEKNVKLLFFSPYVKIKKKSDEIIFYNYIFETVTLIKCNKNIEKLFQSIKRGIEMQNLLEEVNEYFEENATEIVNKLIVNGVIE